MAIIELGFAPSGENCVQVGQPNYPEQARKECNRFIRQLKRQLPIPEKLEGDVQYQVRSNPYEGSDGSDTPYLEVVVRFNPENPKALDFACNAERKVPEFWDTIAKVEIAIENGWHERFTNAPRSYDQPGCNGVLTAETFSKLIELGQPWRRVLIHPDSLEWQTGRYLSGYPVWDNVEWEKVLQLLEKRQQNSGSIPGEVSNSASE